MPKRKVKLANSWPWLAVTELSQFARLLANKPVWHWADRRNDRQSASFIHSFPLPFYCRFHVCPWLQSNVRPPCSTNIISSGGLIDFYSLTEIETQIDWQDESEQDRWPDHSRLAVAMIATVDVISEKIITQKLIDWTSHWLSLLFAVEASSSGGANHNGASASFQTTIQWIAWGTSTRMRRVHCSSTAACALGAHRGCTHWPLALNGVHL